MSNHLTINRNLLHRLRPSQARTLAFLSPSTALTTARFTRPSATPPTSSTTSTTDDHHHSFHSNPVLHAMGDTSTIDFFHFPANATLRPTASAKEELLFLMSRVPIISSSSSTTSASLPSAATVTSTATSIATSALSALGLASSSPPPPAAKDDDLRSAARQGRKDGYDSGDIMRAEISSTSLDSIVLPLSDASDQGGANEGQSGLDFAAFSMVTSSGGVGGTTAEAVTGVGGVAEEVEGKVVEAKGTLGRLWDGLVEDVLGPASSKKSSS